jgi:hypothetical protein
MFLDLHRYLLVVEFTFDCGLPSAGDLSIFYASFPPILFMTYLYLILMGNRSIPGVLP